MPDIDIQKPSPETDELKSATGPHVFISHDTRDAELAEAFGKLLKSVSAGMIKTFRSSDKSGNEGIDFGEEWYKRLMTMLQCTSDVVCLFTERSLGRPWILFEAGVAKGKLDTPVIGVALGVPLGSISAGPFYQFQNMDDSEDALKKLVNQLGRRVQGLELDSDVVETQVATFKASESAILEKLGGPKNALESTGQTEKDTAAKLIEEIKALPSRVAERLSDLDDPLSRRRRNRRMSPMMFEELMHFLGEPGDPVAILMAASVVRDEAPWLYEMAQEAYRAVKSGSRAEIEKELRRLETFSEMAIRGPFFDELVGTKESYMLHRELPRMLHRALIVALEAKPLSPRRRTQQPEIQSS